MSASTAPAPTRNVDVRADAASVGPDGGGRLPAIASVLIALVALATAPFQQGLPGLAAVELAAGTAEVEVSGQWVAMELGQRVGVGTRLRTRNSATATFETGDGRLELRPGTTYALDGLRRLTLERGSLLLAVDELWQVQVGVATVRGEGLLRVDRGALRRAVVYRGGASVRAGGVGTSVEALDQVDLADVDLLEPTPLSYSPDDPWDARFLGAAIAVDVDVAALQRGLAAQYGEELQDAAFYADFLAVDDLLATALPDLAPRESGLRFGPPAPTLTAVVVARTLVDGARLSQGEAVAEIRRERAAGATWGLILADHELGPRALAAATEDALRRRAIAVDEGGAAPVRRAVAVTPPTSGGTGTGTGAPPDARSPSAPEGPADPPGPGTDPGSDPGQDPDADPDPATGVVPEELDDTLDGVEDQVDELLGTIPVPGDDDAPGPLDVPLP